uniref:Uncharacterized protein n=1 Tax=Meloidogyne enterolobii TaxID=390850 RepID=A0A6V7W6T4_MELEN|nr:unnamed protein product [Meloidogyne enterolobii]
MIFFFFLFFLATKNFLGLFLINNIGQKLDRKIRRFVHTLNLQQKIPIILLFYWNTQKSTGVLSLSLLRA